MTVRMLVPIDQKEYLKEQKSIPIEHTLLGYHQAFDQAEEGGVIEHNSKQKLYIRPAGYTKDITIYPPYPLEHKQLNEQKFANRKGVHLWLHEKARNLYMTNCTGVPAAEYPFNIYSQHEIILVPENNPHDSNAILIVLRSSQEHFQYVNYQQLGYVPKTYSKVIKENLSNIRAGRIYRIVGIKEPFCAIVSFDFKIDLQKIRHTQNFKRFTRILNV